MQPGGDLQLVAIGVRPSFGWSGFAELVLFVGCTPLLAVLNLWFWSLSLVWVTLHAAFVQSLYPGAAYHLALAVWAFGNLAVIYVSLVTVRVARRPDLLVACLLSPLYWVLMSVAAVRAAIQLVTDPSHWEKTAHGLGGGGEEYDEGPVADSSNAHA